ncbi:triphosphoribosyl-dephospho-CoA synthase MdcB [Orrella sp. JC864]|uniref:triphosphoribosyl-dephospho-CoA synthase MdcB n=1 Tax=Orrella sp. JC864 TaxID=3120298 RepID=UPI003009CCFA
MLNAQPSPLAPACAAAAQRLSRLALRSLYAELALYPKPGLVSPVDSGSHDDMDAATFLRSLFALRRYYADIAMAGMQQAGFARLRGLGMAAEARMLRATGGVNTHRGAIFALGLLAAAAGRLWAQDAAADDQAWRAALRCWTRELRLVPAAPSHGMLAAARYQAGGARAQALQGFPAVFELALPALRTALAQGACPRRARLHALFHLLAQLEDTNLLYRGGREGLDWLRGQARAFLADGGVFAPGWLARAQAMHQACRVRRLSPGGSADMLAAACFVHAWQGDTADLRYPRGRP